MSNNIDYVLLGDAVRYYKMKGFEYQDVEWQVPFEVIRITTPPNCKLYEIDKGFSLVASAEQSYLDLMVQDKLKPGRYMTVSPCFRDDIIDDLHARYFMKLELIDTLTVTPESLLNIVKICDDFFSCFLKTKIILTGEFSYDIIDTVNNIELGSYGIRHDDKFNLDWIYATGVAEPRLSKAVALSKQ